MMLDRLSIPIFKGSVEREIESSYDLPIGHERILFVDDEPSLVKMGKQRLERLGYQVIAVADPLEALAKFQKDPDSFDLVITDMAIPTMTGDQLIIEILKTYPDTLTMLCTGYSEKISEEKTYVIGIRSFVMKPLDRKDLAVCVREVLDQAKCRIQD